MIGAGVHALAPLGSTGCLPYLDDAEREAVVETVVGAAADRLPVLAGVSSLGTASPCATRATPSAPARRRCRCCPAPTGN